MTNKTTLKLGAIALGALMMTPAHAIDVKIPDGAPYEIRFWNTDVEQQWLIVAPRAPAIIQGTERVARTGLANAQRRQSDLRGALQLGDATSEGGVWARVGGAFGTQDDQDLRFGELSRTVKVDTVDVTQSDELAFQAGLALAARLGERYRAAYADQQWFIDLPTNGDRDARVLADAATAITTLSYDEQLSHFNVGVDFISGNRAEGAWIVGGAIGYVRASQEFDDFKTLNQGSKFDWDSVNLGAYASYVKGGIYLDAALSYGWHSIDLKLPVLNMVPAGSMIDTDGQTAALSVDAGWRISLNDSLYIEPRLSAVWIRSDLEDAKVQRADALTHNGQFNTLNYGDPESRRVGLGAELGQDLKLGELTLTGTLGARYWHELDADRELALTAQGKRVDTTVTNDPGTATQVTLPTLISKEAEGYTQVTLGTNLRNADRSLSGGLSLDYLTGGDFDSYGVTASLRYQW